MAARKKTRRRKATGVAGRKKSSRKTKTRRTKLAPKKKAGRRKPSRRERPTAIRKRPRRSVSASARSSAASLADRLTELVEHAAAGALRRVVDTGGREISAWLPEAPAMRREAGDYVRELRELAGLTIEEMTEAVELSDQSVLEAVEAGTATLSFELILRLAAILARHDPVPFISRLVRCYNPVLWQLLEDWGIGRLPLQLEREREFVNILRGHDEARALSEEDFEQVLAFTRTSFETALHFASKQTARNTPGRAEEPDATPPRQA
jgi:transcriptional regulator with XRE-family HTH domain